MRRPTPKIHELMNPDSAAVQSTRCHVTSFATADASASADETTSQHAPAATHRRKGSRPETPEASVRRMTVQNKIEAASSDALPASHSGRVIEVTRLAARQA